MEFPTLLDSPRPRLRAYPPETVIAEKLEARVRLGLANSRINDFFDIWHLARTHPFEAAVLSAAIRATFAARSTELPVGPITALTPAFADDPGKARQWKAFFRQAAVAEQTPDLSEVVGRLDEFLGPVLSSSDSPASTPRRWTPGKGWE